MLSPIAQNASPLASRSNEAQAQSLRQLSTGQRVNEAKDDPAAVALISQFAAQIAGNSQALRNLNDGISLAQTADGALAQVQDNTQRLRELAVQAGNGTLSSQDRAALQAEANALSQSGNDTLRNASFNGQPLFQGGQLDFQAGPDAGGGNQIRVNLGNLADGGLFGPNGRLDLSSAASASAGLEGLDQTLETLGSSRATLGAVSSRFEASVQALANRNENLSASRSRIADTDFAATSSQLVLEQIRNQASIAAQAQANASAPQVLSLLNG